MAVADARVSGRVVVMVLVNLSRDLARSLVDKIGALLICEATVRLADAARDRDLATEFSSRLGDLLTLTGSVRATFLRTIDDFRGETTGAPVTDELSLPPSLVQSSWAAAAAAELCCCRNTFNGFLVVLCSAASEQKLTTLELHEAIVGSSRPPQQLLAYPPLVLLSARCKPLPTAVIVELVTATLDSISKPLSLPSPPLTADLNCCDDDEFMEVNFDCLLLSTSMLSIIIGGWTSVIFIGGLYSVGGLTSWSLLDVGADGSIGKSHCDSVDVIFLLFSSILFARESKAKMLI